LKLQIFVRTVTDCFLTYHCLGYSRPFFAAVCLILVARVRQKIQTHCRSWCSCDWLIIGCKCGRMCDRSDDWPFHRRSHWTRLDSRSYSRNLSHVRMS